MSDLNLTIESQALSRYASELGEFAAASSVQARAMILQRIEWRGYRRGYLACQSNSPYKEDMGK